MTKNEKDAPQISSQIVINSSKSLLKDIQNLEKAVSVVVFW